MNVNILQLMQIMKSGDPRKAIISMLNGVQQNNPMLSNVINMVNKNDVNGIEQFARNVCKERNINFDEEFPKFMSNFNKR